MRKINRFKQSLILFLIIILVFALSGCRNRSSEITSTTAIETTVRASDEITAESSTESSVETSSESSTEAQFSDQEALDEAHEEWVKTNAVKWSLGNAFIDYVGNNRAYDWYIDQAHTGDHSSDNCGPAAVTMAIKWVDGSFSSTAEDARDDYVSGGGWWTTDEISDYLDDYDITYEFYDMPVETKEANINTLMAIIDSGNLALVCTEMKYIPYNDGDNTRVNRFYSFDSGHFFIIKGYVMVDNKTYFEVYDPNNWDATYEDGEPKGKDRYYEAGAVVDAISYWWPYVFSIYAN